MNWDLLGNNLGWLVAAVALAYQAWKDRKKAVDAQLAERSAMQGKLEELGRRVEEVVLEAKANHGKMLDTNLAFWQEKWPLVERAIATNEQLEQRIAALENWRAVHFKNGSRP